MYVRRKWQAEVLNCDYVLQQYEDCEQFAVWLNVGWKLSQSLTPLDLQTTKTTDHTMNISAFICSSHKIICGHLNIKMTWI